jgi:uncharacterized Zn finger protein
MRETAAMKADRLLTSGRVVVVRADGRHIRAQVRGDTEGFHSVEHDGGRWTCDCSHAPYGSCSHRRAVMLVTAPVQPAIYSPSLMVGAVS